MHVLEGAFPDFLHVEDAVPASGLPGHHAGVGVPRLPRSQFMEEAEVHEVVGAVAAEAPGWDGNREHTQTHMIIVGLGCIYLRIGHIIS